MSNYTVTIEHCNSIEKASVSIEKETLNIKYGSNGLGKSSIARAIQLAVNDADSLKSLKPFKYRKDPNQYNPKVTGLENVGSVQIFDEAYVSQFVFQKDEVLKNSFDIFIRTDTYVAAMTEMEELFSGIRGSFDGDSNIESAIGDLKELRDAFGLTKAGGIAKTSKGYKAFGSGNKIENIPDGLVAYGDFIRSDQPAAWISWQTKGNAFSDLSHNCPYCSSDLQQGDKKDAARLVAKEYDSKAIEHLSGLQAIIKRLGKYFETGCRASLDGITRSNVELSPEAETFLTSLRGAVETLLFKLEGLRSISFYALRDVEKIEDSLDLLRIDLKLINQLNSTDTQALVDPINGKLEDLSKRIGELKGRVNRHKAQIQKSVQENQKGINDFLLSAGYRYFVSIQAEGDAYKMKLSHRDSEEHLEAAAKHLSYGERNAFALVLFMYQVLKEKPDLAVLDDPVSSFDKTKKFAILNELFRGKACLRDSTVLLLTHDMEPAIDVLRGVKGKFQKPKPRAHFLISRSGIVSELEILEHDIQTFAQVCSSNVSSVPDDIVKCIYLRRHFEILNDLGVEYNYLASLLHARKDPCYKDGTAMSPAEVAVAENSISRWIPGFTYANVLAAIDDKEGLRQRFGLTTVGYDKLQLFRIFRERHIGWSSDEDDVLRKFVNETFHIENEYVMQINPHKFDGIPEYVIQECERIVAAH